MAASFTLSFCKELNCLNCDNGAALDDPSATVSKVYVWFAEVASADDMPGQGRPMQKMVEEGWRLFAH